MTWPSAPIWRSPSAGPAARARIDPGLPCPPAWLAPRAACSPRTAPGQPPASLQRGVTHPACSGHQPAGPGRHTERPGCMPPTAPGTPESAPQRRRTPKHQHLRRSAARARLLRVLRTVGNRDHRAAEIVFSCIASVRRELPLLPHSVRQFQHDAPVPPLDAASARTWTSDPWPQAGQSNRRWTEADSPAMPIVSVTRGDRACLEERAPTCR